MKLYSVLGTLYGAVLYGDNLKFVGRLKVGQMSYRRPAGLGETNKTDTDWGHCLVL